MKKAKILVDKKWENSEFKLYVIAAFTPEINGEKLINYILEKSLSQPELINLNEIEQRLEVLTVSEEDFLISKKYLSTKDGLKGKKYINAETIQPTFGGKISMKSFYK